MPAQIEELTEYYRLWNDHDEWFVEKTGIQMSNDYGSPWAHIWAGFRGIEDKPNADWEEFLVDDVSWTWSTDSGTGWAKLIGDAGFGPGGKLAVHVEWILEDDDTLLELKWKTTNDWKDWADVKQIIRNGQIDVNGGGADCWYRFYKTDNTLLDGQLPADVSYNNITDSLKNRYKLIGNSKDIDWRWDETYDKNGTPTSPDVTVNVVNTDGKYGSNGYVEHVFNIGAVNKGEYIETVQHWHDAETYYVASLNVFEMDGTDRPWKDTRKGVEAAKQTYTAGTTVLTLGSTNSDWLSGSFQASASYKVGRIEVELANAPTKTPPGTISCEIYSPVGPPPGTPFASIGTAEETYDTGDLTESYVYYRFTFLSPPSLTSGTYYHIVLKTTTQSDTDTYRTRYDGAGANIVHRYDSGWNIIDATAEFNHKIYAAGNTVKQLCPQGIIGTESEDSVSGWDAVNNEDKKVAVGFKGGGQTITSIKFRAKMTKSNGGPTGNMTVGIQDNSGANPDGSWNTSGTIDVSTFTTSLAWYTVTVTSETLTKDDILWVVFDCTALSQSDTDYVSIGGMYAAASDFIPATGSDYAWFVNALDYSATNGWLSCSDKPPEFLLIGAGGDSDYGLLGASTYTDADADIFDHGNLGSSVHPLIKNDETTLYRTVFQVKAIGDTWNFDGDADDDAYFDNGDAGTAWGGFETAFNSTKWFVDEGAGPEAAGNNTFTSDVVGSGVQATEWNGTDALLSNGAAPASSGGVDSGDDRIECVKAGRNNWEDNTLTDQIAEDNWGAWEWWFKVASDFVAEDTPEVFYYNVGGGGGVTLTHCGFVYEIETAEEEAFTGLGPFMTLI